jgi:hypothetical protein
MAGMRRGLVMAHVEVAIQGIQVGGEGASQRLLA